MDVRGILTPRERAYAVAHEAYLNHVLRCASCYAPNRRYCSAGKALHTDNEAHYLMLLDLLQRRTILAKDEAKTPGSSEAVKARMLELHKERNISDE